LTLDRDATSMVYARCALLFRYGRFGMRVESGEMVERGGRLRVLEKFGGPRGYEAHCGSVVGCGAC
jgi:hypothetical protein